MKRTGTLVLAALAALLGVYIFFFERHSLTSSELDARKGRLLGTFVREKVDRLEIQRKGKTVVVERGLEDGAFGSWKMLEPLETGADETVIDHVLGELEWLDARRTLSNVSKEDRSRFGLEKPRYRVTYRAGGARHTLVLGLEDVRGQGVYAAVAGEPDAYIVPKTLLETLDHEPGHFRSKALVSDMTKGWARKIEIERGGKVEQLEKKDATWWVSDEPKTLGDPKRIDQLLTGIDEARAVRLLEGAEAEAAKQKLAKAELRLRVQIIPDEEREDKKPSLVTFAIAGACDGHDGERYVVASSDAPACMKTEDLAPLLVPLEQLRLRAPFAFDRSEIEAIEHTSGGQTLKLTREGEGWKGEGGLAVDRDAVEAWLRDLSEQRATSFTQPQAFTERARLTFSRVDDQKSTLLLGGTAPDGSVYVKRDHEAVAAVFPARMGDDLAPSKQRFSSLDLWSHKPSEILSASAISGPMSRALVLEDGAWKPGKGEAEVKDAGNVRELVRELAKPTALAFVAERARPEHGFTNLTGKLVLTVASKSGAPTTLTLELGAKTPRGAYARRAGGPVVEVPNEVVAHVNELAGGEPAPKPAGADELEDPDDDDDAEDGHDHAAHDHAH